MGTVSIPLHSRKRPGLFAFIDEDDYERVSLHRWHLTNAYPCTTINGHEIYLHRFILDAPSNVAVDHRNRDKLDARKANLRLATPTENARNNGGKSARQHSYKGISYDPRDGMWYPRIYLDGRKPSLGRYATAGDAAQIYDAVARFYYGEFACTNFPEGETLSVEDVHKRVIANRKIGATSRFVGVTYDPRYDLPWRINIQKHGKSIHRMRFATEEEAAEAYTRLKMEVERE